MAINGLTQKTSKKLYELTNTDKKQAVSPMLKKPSAPDEAYSKAKDKLLSEYLKREPYDFNINTDKLYAQYADRYKRQGEAAMRDTVADAATKTGGYTSSYGISAGSQAYQGYLDKLNDIIPELEAAAYDRYINEGKETENKLDLLDSFDSKEYDRYRDEVEDYKDMRDYYRDIYKFESDSDLAMYKALTDYILSVAQLENKDYHDHKDREVALAKLYNSQ